MNKKTGVKLLAVIAFVASMSSSRADRTRWVETHSWSGEGMMTTEPFLVTGDRWRVVARRFDDAPRNIFILDVAGNEVDKTLILERGVMAIKNLRGAGTYHLSVRDVEGRWSLRVHQRLSVIDEWNLRQALLQPPPLLNKTSHWSGEDGRHSFSFTVPEDKKWKLVSTGTTSEEGRFRLRVTQLKTTEKAEFVHLAKGKIDGSQWFLHGGDFELTIHATGATWKAEVQTE